MGLLSVSQISASYGDSQALFDVSFEIEGGEVMALLGRNGVGKSTTIKSVCGMLPISQGIIRFNGQDIMRLPSHKIARLGIGLAPEGRRCFPNLSVEENLLVAARDGYWTLNRMTSLFPRLGERADQLAASLSGGEQQMLAIGRALMTNPKLLILDEATEGLAPVIRQEIWSVIEQLKIQYDLAILLVDKSLRELRRVADKAVIIQRGESVWRGTMNKLTNEVAERYLGL